MRLVSLCPSITESLAALGLAGDLAGVTRYCVHPKEALTGVPRVGGTKNPDFDAIRAARPDLVFCNAEENRNEDVAALRREFRVDVSHPRTVGEVPALLRHFGEVTGREEKAREISLKVEEALQRVDEEAARRAAGAPGSSAAGSTFSYVYLIWKDPLMTIGPRTYVADLLRRVGGSSSLSLSLEESSNGESSDYPATTEEKVLASRPDVLILPDEPYPFRENDAKRWRGKLPAISRVFPVHGDDFCWHGVRTLRGLEAAERLAREIGGVGR